MSKRKKLPPPLCPICCKPATNLGRLRLVCQSCRFVFARPDWKAVVARRREVARGQG